jgi:hypothetical protein
VAEEQARENRAGENGASENGAGEDESGDQVEERALKRARVATGAPRRSRRHV